MAGVSTESTDSGSPSTGSRVDQWIKQQQEDQVKNAFFYTYCMYMYMYTYLRDVNFTDFVEDIAFVKIYS